VANRFAIIEYRALITSPRIAPERGLAPANQPQKLAFPFFHNEPLPARRGGERVGTVCANCFEAQHGGEGKS
jgi:hypothetical protein